MEDSPVPRVGRELRGKVGHSSIQHVKLYTVLVCHLNVYYTALCDMERYAGYLKQHINDESRLPSQMTAAEPRYCQTSYY